MIEYIAFMTGSLMIAFGIIRALRMRGRCKQPNIDIDWNFGYDASKHDVTGKFSSQVRRTFEEMVSAYPGHRHLVSSYDVVFHADGPTTWKAEGWLFYTSDEYKESKEVLT